MYYVLGEKYDETYAYVEGFESDIPESYELLEGISRADGWPENLTGQFSKQRPEGMILTDWIKNESDWLMISDRFKKLLESVELGSVEYLPIKIKNHKGKIVSKDYWIVNFLVHTEAVDREMSIYDDHPVYEDKIFSFEKLILKKEILKSGPAIFRLKERPPRMVLARQDLVERLKKEGLTGMEFIETDKYKSI